MYVTIYQKSKYTRVLFKMLKEQKINKFYND